MRKSTSFIIALFILLPLATYAQTNRKNTKKSVAYKANYQRMSTGCIANHTLEIREGTLWAWGYNNVGQLGDGTTTQSNIPKQIGNDTKWISTATGLNHSLGLKSDGTLWAWGLNNYGQLGDGSYTQRTSPVQIGNDNKWISVVAGYAHSLALKSDGTLWAWGWNQQGQLGDNSNINKNIPTQIGTENKWTLISAGSYHTHGIKSDGSLWSWGLNNYGQLGDLTSINRIIPVRVGLENNWAIIQAGEYHSLALKANGTLWAWGYNAYGQLGDSTMSSIIRAVPTQIGNENKWVCIATGQWFSMGLKSNGTLWTWGYNTQGQLGDGTTSHKIVPTQIGLDDKWVSIASGASRSFGLKVDGTLWSWGFNGFGGLGDGTILQRTNPIQILNDNKWLSIAEGSDYTIGLKSNGTLWGWGQNIHGQLGDSTIINRSIPFPIGIDNKWVSASSGRHHTLGLKSNGTIWTWGDNSYGQLCDGTTTDRSSPIQIGLENKWVSVVTGFYHSLGIKSDGTLWAWGFNGAGMLGDSTNINRSNPIQIGSDSKWVSIAAGSFHTIGLKSDGTLWSWGANGNGQLGIGNNTNRISPTQIGSDNNWVSVAAGEFFSLGLKSNGTLWSWGFNSYGQLGDGTNTNRNNAAQIGTDSNWISISVGYNHCIGLKSNGTYYAWGDNSFGQLGDGTTTNRNNPLQIGTENKWVVISAGGNQSLGLKSDRIQFCATGSNNYGQLGDNTTTDKNSFVCNSNCLPPLPPISTTPLVNLTVCNGNATTLSAGGIGTLRWYSNAIGGSHLSVGATYVTNGLNSPTTFYVQDSTCAVSTIRTGINVLLHPQINAGFTINKSIQCENENSFLFTDTSTISIGTLNRIWHLGSNDTSNSMSKIKVFNSPGNYNIKLVLTNSTGCKDSISKVITVNPKPIVGFTINNSVQCLKGNYFNFADTSVISSGSLTRLWNFEGGDTSTSNNPNKIFNNEGISTVKLMATSNNGCKDSLSKQITVNPHPGATATVIGSTSFCNGGSVLLNANLGTGLTYQWKTNGINTVNGNNANFLATLPGNYKVFVNNTYNCVDSSNSVNVTVNPNPIAAFRINKTEQCLRGNEFIFTDSSQIISGNINQHWDFGDSNTDTSKIAHHSYLTEGNYVVKLISTSIFSCSDTAITNVIINSHPKSGFTISSPTQQCLRFNRFEFNDTTNINNGSYNRLWKFGDDSSQILGTPSHHYKIAGNYNVLLIITNNKACIDSTSKNITVNPQPGAFIFEPTTNQFCVNDSLQLEANTGDKFNYQWIKNDTSIIALNQSKTFINEAGNYKVIVTNDFQCIDTSNTFIAYINQLPIIGNVLGPQTVNNISTLVNYNISQKLNHQYLWTVTGGNIVSGQGTNNITVQWASAGIGRVMIKLTNANNCSDTSGVNVSISPTGLDNFRNINSISIYPNPFNDKLIVSTQNYAPLSFYLYDIQGRLILENEINEKTEFIGLNQLSSGVYLAIIKDGQLTSTYRVVKN